MNNPVKSVNKSRAQAEHLLRRQIAQARRELSQSMAVRLVHVRNVPIKDTMRAEMVIAEAEAGLNGSVEMEL